jgi:riboflavin synthase
MFSGIVTDLGELLAAEALVDGTRRLTIACRYPADGIVTGSSIACSGVCLTVTKTGHRGDRTWFSVDAAAETLRVSTIAGWRVGRRINLERALRMGEEIGGHLVSGHVDGRAKVTARADIGATARFTLCAPAEFARFIASKGSVSLDGVSLTVNDVANDTFSVLIVRYTLQVTTLGELAIGDDANLEIDLIARYAARLLEHTQLPGR